MKIMYVNYTMNLGGVETFLVNVCKNMDSKKYEFIFLTYDNSEFYYDNLLKEINCKIIKTKNKNFLENFISTYKIIKQLKPDVVHCNIYFHSIMVMIAAKLAGVKIRITHSHSAMADLEKNNIKKRINKIIQWLLNYFCTSKLACSKEAGNALFGKYDFEIISNGIEFDKFYYNEEMRIKYRKDLKIAKNEIVIGHVGRLEQVKNHKFLLDIFKSILNKNSNYKLILVGSGTLENELKEYSKKLNIKDKVLFLGNRNDINKILNCFDIIVFPSIYEGLPISLVESQANGLKIIASDTISKEVDITNNIKFYSLEKSAKDWANQVLLINKTRKNVKEYINNSDYSIKTTTNKLEKIYNSKY